MMKKAVVLGASGGMGYALVQELISREVEVIAFARNKEKLERLFGQLRGVEIITGDVLNLQDLLKACNGADVIFQSALVPYHEWEEKLPKMIHNVIAAARQVSAKIVIVDNIYAYGKNPGIKVTEDQPKCPHTKKGKIRLQMEDLIKRAHDQGVPSLTAHLPDYYGPNAENTLMHTTLKAIVENKKAYFVGDHNTKREFIYTPDGAKAMVELALRDSSYGHNWNIPAFDVITGKEIIEILRKITGYQKRVGTITKWMIQFIGLFNPFMREVVEMLYLTVDPVVLSGAKYAGKIGPLPRTNYEEGLRQTIVFMKRK